MSQLRLRLRLRLRLPQGWTRAESRLMSQARLANRTDYVVRPLNRVRSPCPWLIRDLTMHPAIAAAAVAAAAAAAHALSQERPQEGYHRRKTWRRSMHQVMGRER